MTVIRYLYNDLLFVSDQHRLSKRSVLAADVLYKGSGLKDNKIVIRIINPMQYNMFYKGTKLGRIQVLSDFRSRKKEKKDSDKVVKEILDAHAYKISRNQLLELKKIHNRFKCIFSRSSTDVRCIQGAKHEIET